MKDLREFALETKDDKVAFLPGEIVRGELYLCLEEPVEIKCIKVYLVGEGEGAWIRQATPSKTSSRKNSKEVVKKHYLINIGLIAFGYKEEDKTQTEVHESGRYVYEFEFDLPPHLPPTFRSPGDKDLGFARYFLKAVMSRPKKHEREIRQRIVINELLDPERPELSFQPGKFEEKNVKSLCMPSGTISLESYLNRASYTQGDKILINALAENKSSKVMKELYAVLIRRVHSKSRYGTTTYTTEETRINGARIPANERLEWKEHPLSVPPVGPTITGNHDIRVDYIVRVGMYEDLGSELHLDLPVVIGTVGTKEEMDLQNAQEEEETQQNLMDTDREKYGLKLIKAKDRGNYRNALQSKQFQDGGKDIKSLNEKINISQDNYDMESSDSIVLKSFDDNANRNNRKQKGDTPRSSSAPLQRGRLNTPNKNTEDKKRGVSPRYGTSNQTKDNKEKKETGNKHKDGAVQNKDYDRGKAMGESKLNKTSGGGQKPIEPEDEQKQSSSDPQSGSIKRKNISKSQETISNQKDSFPGNRSRRESFGGSERELNNNEVDFMGSKGQLGESAIPISGSFDSFEQQKKSSSQTSLKGSRKLSSTGKNQTETRSEINNDRKSPRSKNDLRKSDPSLKKEEHQKSGDNKNAVPSRRSSDSNKQNKDTKGKTAPVGILKKSKESLQKEAENKNDKARKNDLNEKVNKKNVLHDDIVPSNAVLDTSGNDSFDRIDVPDMGRGKVPKDDSDVKGDSSAKHPQQEKSLNDNEDNRVKSNSIQPDIRDNSSKQLSDDNNDIGGKNENNNDPFYKKGIDKIKGGIKSIWRGKDEDDRDANYNENERDKNISIDEEDLMKKKLQADGKDEINEREKKDPLNRTRGKLSDVQPPRKLSEMKRDTLKKEENKNKDNKETANLNKSNIIECPGETFKPIKASEKSKTSKEEEIGSQVKVIPFNETKEKPSKSKTQTYSPIDHEKLKADKLASKQLIDAGKSNAQFLPRKNKDQIEGTGDEIGSLDAVDKGIYGEERLPERLNLLDEKKHRAPDDSNNKNDQQRKDDRKISPEKETDTKKTSAMETKKLNDFPNDTRSLNENKKTNKQDKKDIESNNNNTRRLSDADKNESFLEKADRKIKEIFKSPRPNENEDIEKKNDRRDSLGRRRSFKDFFKSSKKNEDEPESSISNASVPQIDHEKKSDDGKTRSSSFDGKNKETKKVEDSEKEVKQPNDPAKRKKDGKSTDREDNKKFPSDDKKDQGVKDQQPIKKEKTSDNTNELLSVSHDEYYDALKSLTQDPDVNDKKTDRGDSKPIESSTIQPTTITFHDPTDEESYLKEFEKLEQQMKDNNEANKKQTKKVETGEIDPNQSLDYTPMSPIHEETDEAESPRKKKESDISPGKKRKFTEKIRRKEDNKPVVKKDASDSEKVEGDTSFIEKDVSKEEGKLNVTFNSDEDLLDRSGDVSIDEMKDSEPNKSFDSQADKGEEEQRRSKSPWQAVEKFGKWLFGYKEDDKSADQQEHDNNQKDISQSNGEKAGPESRDFKSKQQSQSKDKTDGKSKKTNQRPTSAVTKPSTTGAKTNASATRPTTATTKSNTTPTKQNTTPTKQNTTPSKSNKATAKPTNTASPKVKPKPRGTTNHNLRNQSENKDTAKTKSPINKRKEKGVTTSIREPMKGRGSPKTSPTQSKRNVTSTIGKPKYDEQKNKMKDIRSQYSPKSREKLNQKDKLIKDNKLSQGNSQSPNASPLSRKKPTTANSRKKDSNVTDAPDITDGPDAFLSDDSLEGDVNERNRKKQSVGKSPKRSTTRQIPQLSKEASKSSSASDINKSPFDSLTNTPKKTFSTSPKMKPSPLTSHHVPTAVQNVRKDSASSDDSFYSASEYDDDNLPTYGDKSGYDDNVRKQTKIPHRRTSEHRHGKKDSTSSKTEPSKRNEKRGDVGRHDESGKYVDRHEESGKYVDRHEESGKDVGRHDESGKDVGRTEGSGNSSRESVSTYEERQAKLTKSPSFESIDQPTNIEGRPPRDSQKAGDDDEGYGTISRSRKKESPTDGGRTYAPTNQNVTDDAKEKSAASKKRPVKKRENEKVAEERQGRSTPSWRDSLRRNEAGRKSPVKRPAWNDSVKIVDPTPRDHSLDGSSSPSAARKISTKTERAGTLSRSVSSPVVNRKSRDSSSDNTLRKSPPSSERVINKSSSASPSLVRKSSIKLKRSSSDTRSPFLARKQSSEVNKRTGTEKITSPTEQSIMNDDLKRHRNSLGKTGQSKTKSTGDVKQNFQQESEWKEGRQMSSPNYIDDSNLKSRLDDDRNSDWLDENKRKISINQNDDTTISDDVFYESDKNNENLQLPPTPPKRHNKTQDLSSQYPLQQNSDIDDDETPETIVSYDNNTHQFVYEERARSTSPSKDNKVRSSEHLSRSYEYSKFDDTNRSKSQEELSTRRERYAYDNNNDVETSLKQRVPSEKDIKYADDKESAVSEKEGSPLRAPKYVDHDESDGERESKWRRDTDRKNERRDDRKTYAPSDTVANNIYDKKANEKDNRDKIKPSDRQTSTSSRNIKPTPINDNKEHPYSSNDRPYDVDKRPYHTNDRPYDNKYRPQENNDRPTDRNDRPYDSNDHSYDNNDHSCNSNDRPYDNNNRLNNNENRQQETKNRKVPTKLTQKEDNKRNIRPEREQKNEMAKDSFPRSNKDGKEKEDSLFVEPKSRHSKCFPSEVQKEKPQKPAQKSILKTPKEEKAREIYPGVYYKPSGAEMQSPIPYEHVKNKLLKETVAEVTDEDMSERSSIRSDTDNSLKLPSPPSTKDLSKNKPPEAKPQSKISSNRSPRTVGKDENAIVLSVSNQQRKSPRGSSHIPTREHGKTKPYSPYDYKEDYEEDPTYYPTPRPDTASPHPRSRTTSREGIDRLYSRDRSNEERQRTRSEETTRFTSYGRDEANIREKSPQRKYSDGGYSRAQPSGSSSSSKYTEGNIHVNSRGPILPYVGYIERKDEEREGKDRSLKDLRLPQTPPENPVETVELKIKPKQQKRNGKEKLKLPAAPSKKPSEDKISQMILPEIKAEPTVIATPIAYEINFDKRKNTKYTTSKHTNKSKPFTESRNKEPYRPRSLSPNTKKKPQVFRARSLSPNKDGYLIKTRPIKPASYQQPTYHSKQADHVTSSNKQVAQKEVRKTSGRNTPTKSSSDRRPQSPNKTTPSSKDYIELGLAGPRHKTAKKDKKEDVLDGRTRDQKAYDDRMLVGGGLTFQTHSPKHKVKAPKSSVNPSSYAQPIQSNNASAFSTDKEKRYSPRKDEESTLSQQKKQSPKKSPSLNRKTREDENTKRDEHNHSPEKCGVCKGVLPQNIDVIDATPKQDVTHHVTIYNQRTELSNEELLWEQKIKDYINKNKLRTGDQNTEQKLPQPHQRKGSGNEIVLGLKPSDKTSSQREITDLMKRPRSDRRYTDKYTVDDPNKIIPPKSIVRPIEPTTKRHGYEVENVHSSSYIPSRSSTELKQKQQPYSLNVSQGKNNKSLSRSMDESFDSFEFHEQSLGIVDEHGRAKRNSQLLQISQDGREGTTGQEKTVGPNKQSSHESLALPKQPEVGRQ